MKIVLALLLAVVGIVILFVGLWNGLNSFPELNIFGLVVAGVGMAVVMAAVAIEEHLRKNKGP